MWNRMKSLRNCEKLVVNYSTVNVKRVNNQVKSWEEIPGPKSFPLIKQAYNFIPGIGAFGGMEMVEVGKYFHKNFGPIVRFDGMLGSRPMIFLYDPVAIEFVLRSENSTPTRSGFDSLEYFRKKYNRVDEEKRPTGLLTDNNDNWKSFRSTVNPVMLQPKTIKLYHSVLDEVATDMIQRIKTIRNNKYMIDDFELEMNKWSLESIGTVALGGRIGCLDPSLPEDSEALQLIQCVTEIFEISNELNFKPSLWRYFSTKNFKKAMNLYQKQWDLSKHFINKARKDLESTKRSEEQKGILEKLLEIDERTALIMASDMLFAGVDTAATAIMGALYLLATNPEKQQKLRHEIKSNFDKRPYLKACLKEIHRVMPVVSGNLRQSTKEYELCGYNIPKGVNIILNHQYLCMLDEQYPKAKEFIPERWLVDKNDPLYYGNAHAFANSPFGYGSRMCIGKRIAELEIEVFLSRLVENFQVEWFGPPPKVKTASINYLQGPFNFVLRDI